MMSQKDRVMTVYLGCLLAHGNSWIARKFVTFSDYANGTFSPGIDLGGEQLGVTSFEAFA